MIEPVDEQSTGGLHIMARYWNAGDPIKLEAVCSQEQAVQLIDFDHHQVVAAGIWGILITYPWMQLEDNDAPLIVTVVFHLAPQHLTSEAQVRTAIRQHPLAPPEVQTVIDQLDFRPG